MGERPKPAIVIFQGSAKFITKSSTLVGKRILQ